MPGPGYPFSLSWRFIFTSNLQDNLQGNQRLPSLHRLAVKSKVLSFPNIIYTLNAQHHRIEGLHAPPKKGSQRSQRISQARSGSAIAASRNSSSYVLSSNNVGFMFTSILDLPEPPLPPEEADDGLVCLLFEASKLKMDRVAHCGVTEGWKCPACKEHIELEQKIQDFHERRRQVRTEMNANHDPFILRLPLEIASHIFLLAKGTTPYRFGAVCSGWRQLTRSIPQLWSRLRFSVLGPTNPTRMETMLRLVVDWLERSGGLPLSLHVFYHPSDFTGSGPSNELVSIIHMFNQHSGRWQDVLFILPHVYLRQLCLTSPPKNLRNVSISEVAAADTSESPRFSMNWSPS
ncbi:hypothetical protein M413DRAFT_199169 [Hebeloma cylindrosporum]|uniref:F-box domain-containing protein n=1 Tax=Hebeloma cylindrosporum TaxID=76867 RepID=A0A0C3CF75_HEBCY|nr:hypothetical protein M413DRAFT_199169 [Hebeloma cylindrosporum h7]